MSLMSELEDLGETMADNLVSMGVTDAQASDGLTTLANRILDVPQGGSCIQISLTSNKSILSYADSETTTLTATVTENGTPKDNTSVQFYKDNVAYGNPVSTDSSGIATISYSSSGVGDVSFTASVGIISSEIYEVQDCKYWNDGSSVGSLEVGSNVSCTSNGDYITITTSTNGEKYVRLPVTLANTDNWIYEVEIADTVTGSTNQPIALNYDDASKWAGHSVNSNQWFANSGVNDTYTQAYQVGDVLRITRENGYDKVQVNDHQYSNRQATHNATFKVGFYTNNGRTQKVKNIKLKPL